MAVQNAVPFHQLGVATSSGQFVRQIGSTMGVALFGALLTAGLSAELARHEPPNPTAIVHHLDLSDLQKMALERNLHPNAAAIRSAEAQVQERMVRESFSVAIVQDGLQPSADCRLRADADDRPSPADRPDGPPAAEAAPEPDEGAALAAEHAGESEALTAQRKL